MIRTKVSSDDQSIWRPLQEAAVVGANFWEVEELRGAVGTTQSHEEG